MGGISTEREVSLNSGREVIKYLELLEHEIIPIIVDKKKMLWKRLKV